MSSVTDRLAVVAERRFAGVRDELGHPAKHPRTAVVLGRLLGAAFLICFATGLYSHLLQDPLPGMVFPTRPVWLYQASQGVHVTVGVALLPLLFAKLWTVYPKLFEWPPVRSIPHAIERASIAVLVAVAVMEPLIGLINTYQWYPWEFSFRRTHFALAWVLVGALAVHVAVKLPDIVRYWRRGSDAPEPDEPSSPAPREEDPHA
ncbi:hypothetical protein ARHIZOSPH14_24470 [Agromyces rhizosphaerae]|uniref:Molybdopterin-binding protein n=1 Tax=Agromyces rhizosphaerae TaxID=88374 RepID=A0A9W6CYY1_9MICO|nr:hypothetical protein [Agromyces rhizosphaerae]GLI28205.1 hypothetical protein ARHIZOSPH14_24470 [Agromyces rhizosphaerae]